jgi:hypothetical protein
MGRPGACLLLTLLAASGVTMSAAGAETCAEAYARSFFSQAMAKMGLADLSPETVRKVEEVFVRHANRLFADLSPREARRLSAILAEARETSRAGQGGQYLLGAITYSPEYRGTWEGLGLLLHEGRHTADDTWGRFLRRFNPFYRDTIEAETRAYGAQHDFFRDLFNVLDPEELTRTTERVLSLTPSEAAVLRARVAHKKGLQIHQPEPMSFDAAATSLDKKLATMPTADVEKLAIVYFNSKQAFIQHQLATPAYTSRIAMERMIGKGQLAAYGYVGYSIVRSVIDATTPDETSSP